MIGGPGPSAAVGSVQDPVDHAVELELTAAEQLEPLQAAKAAARLPELVPSKPGHDSFICRRTERIDFLCTLTFAALVLGITVPIGWRALVGQPTAAALAIAAAPVAPLPVAPAQPRGPVVQVINPFDATEVFEFPGATTASEARSAIAELLLQRARERRRQGPYLRRASKGHQSPSISADNRPDILLTRVSAN